MHEPRSRAATGGGLRGLTKQEQSGGTNYCGGERRVPIAWGYARGSDVQDEHRDVGGRGVARALTGLNGLRCAAGSGRKRITLRARAVACAGESRSVSTDHLTRGAQIRQGGFDTLRSSCAPCPNPPDCRGHFPENEQDVRARDECFATPSAPRRSLWRVGSSVWCGMGSRTAGPPTGRVSPYST